MLPKASSSLERSAASARHRTGNESRNQATGVRGRRSLRRDSGYAARARGPRIAGAGASRGRGKDRPEGAPRAGTGTCWRTASRSGASSSSALSMLLREAAGCEGTLRSRRDAGAAKTLGGDSSSSAAREALSSVGSGQGMSTPPRRCAGRLRKRRAARPVHDEIGQAGRRRAQPHFPQARAAAESAAADSAQNPEGHRLAEGRVRRTLQPNALEDRASQSVDLGARASSHPGSKRSSRPTGAHTLLFVPQLAA